MDLNLNKLAIEINQANRSKGFYEDTDKLIAVVTQTNKELLPILNQLLVGQRLALITSEISEVLEGNRKGKSFEIGSSWKKALLELNDDEFKALFEAKIKDTEEDEIADTAIRTFDYVGEKKIDLDFHIKAKLRYNSLRPYKHGKKY